MTAQLLRSQALGANSCVVKGVMRAQIEPVTSLVSLDAADVNALADLTTIQQRTALTGTSVFLHAFIVCPGLHLQ